MHKLRIPFAWSPLALVVGAVGVLFVAYIALIAVVMSYAALTVEFTQSVKGDKAAVATLEAQYLAHVARITNVDPIAIGYAAPVAKTFVPARSVTALR